MYDNPKFSGCMYNVEFNRERVNLWKKVLWSQPTAKCCMKPSEYTKPETIDAVSFNGFGFFLSTKRLLMMSGTKSHVSLQFRTFQKDAVLLLVDTLHDDSYYGIFLDVGSVLFAIRTKGQSVMLRSSRTYDNGRWHEVRCCFNSLRIILFS